MAEKISIYKIDIKYSINNNINWKLHLTTAL